MNTIIYNSIIGKQKGSSVFLPLYSYKYHDVMEQSGLNQWNAYGRPRNSYEVYIPISSIFYNRNKGFFPNRDTYFKLQLMNNYGNNEMIVANTILASICQDNNKALMSNPNSDLGRYLFNILNINANISNNPITMQDLINANIDSVLITYQGIDSDRMELYSIMPANIDSFENFIR